MTSIAHKLQGIQAGDVAATEAFRVVREVIETHGAASAKALRTALRGWTWRAMQARRVDEEMRDWYRVIQTASAMLRQLDDRSAVYLEALAHLVEESIRHAAARPLDGLAARAHVLDLLTCVRDADGEIERSELAKRLDVSSSRLSQILTDLIVAGALDRRAEGRRAVYVLTETGRGLLRLRPLAESARHGAEADPVKRTAEPIWSGAEDSLERRYEQLIKNTVFEQAKPETGWLRSVDWLEQRAKRSPVEDVQFEVFYSRFQSGSSLFDLPVLNTEISHDSHFQGMKILELIEGRSRRFCRVEKGKGRDSNLFVGLAQSANAVIRRGVHG